jgi:hypothetical protein
MGRVLLAAVLVTLTAGAPGAEAASATCVAMRVRDSGGMSTVDRTEYPAVATTMLGTIPYRVNALGYLQSRDLAYGMTSSGQVVTIDRRGRTSDLGLPDGRRLTDMTSGAISGNTWYLKGNGFLYTVDIEPGSVSVRGSVLVYPWLLAAEVDDFALDPSDGLLYGVASSGVVVSIDPWSGLARPLPGEHLPPASAYGSVVLAADGTFYVTANRAGGLSREYRVTRGGPVTELGTGSPAASTDAAGCLAPLPAPPPPSSTPPPPPSSVPAPPPPSPSSTTPPAPPPPAAPPPPPAPAVAPAPRPVPPRPTIRPTPPPSTPPTTTRRPPSSKKSAAPVANPLDATKNKRDWALTALILILGGSIVARRIAR